LHLLEKWCELKFIAAAAHADRTDEMHARRDSLLRRIEL